jgi:Pregnancy-associated plasma protein-A
MQVQLPDIPKKRVTVPVYVFTVRKGSEGAVSRWQLRRMRRLLNAAYSGTRFRFRFVSRTIINTHPEWYDLSVAANEAALKAQYRYGEERALNIWTGHTGVASNGNPINGWADKYSPLHGVVVRPDRIDTTTIVHEVGHWFFLEHTHRGGCNNPNDGVGDTPAQKEAIWDCPRLVDTCLDIGPDPIRNYMGYAECRSEFTPEQITRMNYLWKVKVEEGKRIPPP